MGCLKDPSMKLLAFAGHLDWQRMHNDHGWKPIMATGCLHDLWIMTTSLSSGFLEHIFPRHALSTGLQPSKNEMTIVALRLDSASTEEWLKTMRPGAYSPPKHCTLSKGCIFWRRVCPGLIVFNHSFVAALSSLSATVVISLWEGWSPVDEACLGSLCSRNPELKLVVIIQRSCKHPVAMMLDHGFPPMVIVHSLPVKMASNGQQFHAWIFQTAHLQA